ncbi:hypothetical protein FDA36_03975 [Clostridium botulinum]|nr:hypothetical protein [Clostridium botulinum]
MLFVTRQPINVMNYFLETQNDYYAPSFLKFTNGEGVSNLPIERLVGYTPIFVSSIDSDEDLIFTAITSSPSVIECYIVFETEKFDKISLSKWLNYLKCRNTDVELRLQKDEEPEYIVKRICFKQIKKIIPVKGMFNREQDLRYLLSDNFYRQIPLFQKTGRSINDLCQSKENELNRISVNFLRRAVNENYEKAFYKLRKDIRELL